MIRRIICTRRKFSIKSISQPLKILSAISEPNRQNAIAIQDRLGNLSYNELDSLSDKVADHIQTNHTSINSTIAGLNDSNRFYVISMLAAWKLGKRFMPLSPSHTKHEIDYYIKDSDANMVLYSNLASSNANKINIDALVSSSSYLQSLNIETYLQSSAHGTEAVTKTRDMKQSSSSGLVVYTSGKPLRFANHCCHTMY